MIVITMMNNGELLAMTAIQFDQLSIDDYLYIQEYL